MKLKYFLSLFFLLVVFLSFFYSCTKMDVFVEASPQDIENRFFRLSGTEPAAVVKVAETLKKQNALTGFISGFAKKEGYAIWDKSIVEQKMIPTYNRNGENESEETLVYTAIIQQDSNYVNGFFSAAL